MPAQWHVGHSEADVGRPGYLRAQGLQLTLKILYEVLLGQSAGTSRELKVGQGDGSHRPSGLPTTNHRSPLSLKIASTYPCLNPRSIGTVGAGTSLAITQQTGKAHAGSERDRDVTPDTKQAELQQLAPRKQRTGSHSKGAAWLPTSGTETAGTRSYLRSELPFGNSRQGLRPTVTWWVPSGTRPAGYR